MEDKIAELEYRICELERRINDPWRPLLDDMVREYIRKNYPYCELGDGWLYNRVFEEMKGKIRRILMEDE